MAAHAHYKSYIRIFKANFSSCFLLGSREFHVINHMSKFHESTFSLCRNSSKFHFVTKDISIRCLWFLVLYINLYPKSQQMSVANRINKTFFLLILEFKTWIFRKQFMLKTSILHVRDILFCWYYVAMIETQTFLQCVCEIFNKERGYLPWMFVPKIAPANFILGTRVLIQAITSQHGLANCELLYLEFRE